MTYVEKACHDYTAHYHVIKLLGWLKHQPAYDLLFKVLHNTDPIFQKSRTAAVIAFGELEDKRIIPELKKILVQTDIWDLKYACLMTLNKLGDNTSFSIKTKDKDLFVQSKAMDLLSHYDQLQH